MTYSNCYNCENVTVKQPYCELKCLKDSDHHCELVWNEDGTYYYGGKVLMRAEDGNGSELSACKDYKKRKGEIKYEESIEEMYEAELEEEE